MVPLMICRTRNSVFFLRWSGRIVKTRLCFGRNFQNVTVCNFCLKKNVLLFSVKRKMPILFFMNCERPRFIFRETWSRPLLCHHHNMYWHRKSLKKIMFSSATLCHSTRNVQKQKKGQEMRCHCHNSDSLLPLQRKSMSPWWSMDVIGQIQVHQWLFHFKSQTWWVMIEVREIVKTNLLPARKLW